MNGSLVVILVLAILLLILEKYNKTFHKKSIIEEFSPRETLKVEGFNVQSKYNNATDAKNELSFYDSQIKKFINHMHSKYPTQENVKLLKSKYYTGMVYEVAPDDKEKLTAFIRQKKLMGLCLRCKHNHQNFNSRNVTMNVILHELAHLSMHKSDPNHSKEFQKINNWFLQEAENIGIYKPFSGLRSYCGIKAG